MFYSIPVLYVLAMPQTLPFGNF